MPNPSEEAARRVALEVGSWPSIELRVREVGTLRDRSAASTVESHGIEAPGGRRYVEIRTLTPGSEGRQQGYRDGDRCVKIVYDPKDTEVQGHVVIGRSFLNEDQIGHTDRPTPLRFLYVGKVPLEEALPRSTFLREDRAIGRGCGVFRFPKVKWAKKEQDLVYWLDRDTGLPLRVDSFADQASMEAGKPLWSWRAKSFDEVDGHLFPKNSEMSTYDPRTGEEAIHYEETALDVSFHREFPPSAFRPSLQPGVQVFDSIAGKDYRAPGKAPSPGEVVAHVASVPIRATPPTAWTSYLPATGFASGVILLAVAAALRWRRH